jgi:signal transduction histidine kinase
VMSDWMTTDRTLIRTVLQNLLQNAWKFTAGQDDDADSNPSIEFGMTRDADGRIRCYVRDNGAGFDPPTRTRYSRRSSDSTQQPSSPALASASLARWRAGALQIIERHGGRMQAEGAVGKGAAFSFTLGSASPATQGDTANREIPSRKP